MSEGKLKSLTLQEKVRLIGLVENGRAVKEIAEEYNVNRNTLFYILKNREKIRESINTNPGLPNYKRIKTTKCPELERRVLEFMMLQRSHNQKLSGGIIKNQALEIADELGVENFGASNGWLCSFFKRNNISIAEFNRGADPFAEAKKLEYSYEEYYEEVDDSKVDPLIKGETEQPLDEVIETVEYEQEGSEIFTMDAEVEEEAVVENEPPAWLNWCRVCGNRQTLKKVEPEILEQATQVFQISSSDAKICVECKYMLLEISKLNTKARLVEAMFEELQNREETEHLSDTEITDVRLDYGFDYEASTIVEDYVEENEIESIQKFDQSYEGVIFEEVEPETVGEQEDESVLFEEEHFVVEEEEEEEAPVSAKLEPAVYHYECHICNEVFEQMCYLSNHTRVQHQCLPKVACNCGCGRMLSTWESLMAHRRKRSEGEKRHACSLCDQKFTTMTGLKIHIKFKHDKPTKSHDCPECGRHFKDSSVLKAHIRTHLPDEEKFAFECELCGKKMVNKWSLKYHIDTIHEKIVKHFCNICDRGFGNKSNLRSHLISHSTENVPCDLCGGIFKNRISLQSHKKTHKPESARSFACGVCNKTFHNRNHLNRHMISHTDDRVYKCPVAGCNSEYKWPKDLKNHSAVHSGDRPHKCMFCSRDFTDSGNLRKHKLKEHPNELAAFENEMGRRKRPRIVIEERLDMSYEDEATLLEED